jgi:transcriptional regulator with XRE-family HTH domain
MIKVISTIMMDNDMRKGLGLRIKQLRKQHKWTQKELAAKIDVRFPQLNKYESGLHAPPVEKLVKIAEVFDTTVDFLLTGNRSEQRPLHNLRLLERFRALEEFNAEDQEAVIKLIDAMIVKTRWKGPSTRLPKRPANQR